MKQDTNTSIPPSAFTKLPMGSVFQKSEAETIACNIMVILKRTGNIFRRLSWEQYKEERQKDKEFSSGEKYYFDDVIEYCLNAEVAKLFSPIWKESYNAYLKENPTPVNDNGGEGKEEGNAIEDFRIIKDAVFRAYDYLFALGYFTTPTTEGRIVENLLIQARCRTNEISPLIAAAPAMYEALKKIVDFLDADGAIGVNIKVGSPFHQDFKAILNRINKH